MSGFPRLRLRAANAAPVRGGGDYVLYWMIAARRARFNFALDRAVARSAELRKPLVVLETVRCGFRWASARHHRFVLDGMADNARALARPGVLYYPYVEETAGAREGLLAAFARRACLVITDEFPSFLLPGMVAEAAGTLPLLLEAVDSNGLLPMRAADRAFPTALAFRRFLQRVLPGHLGEFPEADPLRDAPLPPAPPVPAEISARWPAASAARLRGDVSALDIDRTVPPSTLRGGATEAARTLVRFVSERLSRYAEDRNRPDVEATSGLSPYLHFGHLSPHEVLASLALQEGWSPRQVSARATGSRAGWWGMGASAEAFLDQLVTWRELGFNTAWAREDHDRYESLPEWARRTLEEHAGDPRPHLYDATTLERSRTHDPLWNAAQTQLIREGRIQGYLRMLWGKKILEWTSSPREALDVMVELNNRFALDGRDPNSYAGIFWVLGRYDRPWGPERPVFGTIRYMSSRSAARKFDVKPYLETWGPSP